MRVALGLRPVLVLRYMLHSKQGVVVGGALCPPM